MSLHSRLAPGRLLRSLRLLATMKRQRPIIETLEARTLLSQGLMITAVTPTLVINSTFDHVDVTFTEAINPTTFTTNDVSLTGPPDVGSESVPDAVAIEGGATHVVGATPGLTSRFQTSLTAADGARLQTPGGLTVGHPPLIIAFDALAGGQMWTIPRGAEPDGGDVHFDASGRFLVVSDDDESQSPLLAMPGGTALERMKPPSALGPDAREMVTQLPASCTGGGINCLIRRGEDRPMLPFGEDIMPYRADRFEFSTDGKFLASGSFGDTIPTLSELSMVSLRQESFGKEEETRTLKPFVETLRVRIPPGKAGPAARSESCVVVGRPILRSVDSEVKGRVIEPRKYKT
ncbi:MAG: hypothetical protein WBX00_15225, partial [Isosphaeraceae bacterium]